MGDDAKTAILARRARFIAVAMAGLAADGCGKSLATTEPAPMPCLSAAPVVLEPEPPPDAGPRPCLQPVATPPDKK